MTEDKITLHFQTSMEMYNEIERIRNAFGWSRSLFIRNAVNEYLPEADASLAQILKSAHNAAVEKQTAADKSDGG